METKELLEVTIVKYAPRCIGVFEGTRLVKTFKRWRDAIAFKADYVASRES